MDWRDIFTLAEDLLTIELERAPTQAEIEERVQKIYENLMCDAHEAACDY